MRHNKLVPSNEDWVVDFFISQYFFDDIYIPPNVFETLKRFKKMGVEK